jgi:hypothetical protein
LLRPLQPFLLQTDDNPLGVPRSVFDGFEETITKDRYAWFTFFFDNFYNVDELRGTRISDQAASASFQVGVGASAYATLARRLEHHFDGFISTIKLGITNALIEGINAKIRLINARGYGHHSAESLTSMIYLMLGGISAKLPTTR